MTSDSQKDQLLEQFQQYLEKSHIDSFSTQEQPDLHTLLSELTGLKTEVKTESRQFKNTLDSLTAALTTVQEDNKSLSAELAVYKQRLEQQQTDIKQTMLLEMLDIYDRLSTGVDVLQNYHPATALFKKSKKRDIRFIDRFKQGQEMTIRRFEETLHRHQVQPIECIGQRLDPLTMNAIETEYHPKIENGLVLEELRRGFLFKDQVLRLAEVKVNKMTHNK